MQVKKLGLGIKHRWIIRQGRLPDFEFKILSMFDTSRSFTDHTHRDVTCVYSGISGVAPGQSL